MIRFTSERKHEHNAEKSGEQLRSYASYEVPSVRRDLLTIDRVASTSSQQTAPQARPIATPSNMGSQHSMGDRPRAWRASTTRPTRKFMMSTPTPPMEFIRPNIAAPCLPLISATTVHQVGSETCRQKRAVAFSSVAVRACSLKRTLPIAAADRKSMPAPQRQRPKRRLLKRLVTKSASSPPAAQPNAPPAITVPVNQPETCSERPRASFRYVGYQLNCM